MDDSQLHADRVALEDALDELEALHARLEVRFGAEHELVAIHNGAASLTLQVIYYADLIEQASEPQSGDPQAAVNDHRHTIDRAVVEFGLARQSFTLAAYRVVGVRLPAMQHTEV